MRSVQLPSVFGHAAWPARPRLWLESVSIDQLDAALRGLAMGIVLLLSLVGYGTEGARVAAPTPPVGPAAVAIGLVLYNIGVVVVLGVPWRRRPGFALFALDWLVVTGAVLLTGGLYSPFLVLYYALVIGGALRLNFRRTLALVLACSAVYALLSRDEIASPGSVGLHLPWFVVGVTSMLMVAMTALAMHRAVDVENTRMQLEQQTAQRLTLLNNLTRTVLSASPDTAALLQTVAAIAPGALQADCALAILFDEGGQALRVAVDQGEAPVLAPGVLAIARAAAVQCAPVVLESVLEDPRGADLRACVGRVESAVCASFLLNGSPVGALLVASYTPRQFRPDELGLLTALGQQIGLSVRLAQLYDLEREKAARSEERERVERDLLNTVSHDLRTPLTAIKTGVSGLLAGERDRPAAELGLLQNIDRSTERLIMLVNDILDMARLRAGRVTLSREQLDVADVLADAVASVRPLTEARGQTVVVQGPLPGTIHISGDRRRLDQVLLNVLYNANKYTPLGGDITVGVTEEPGGVRFWVRDTGPGIDRGEQEHIFEHFYVARTGNAARTESTGLGLAIARSLVALHGGEIGVESRPGAGSLFFFTLPAGETQGPLRG